MKDGEGVFLSNLNMLKYTEIWYIHLNIVHKHKEKHQWPHKQKPPYASLYHCEFSSSRVYYLCPQCNVDKIPSFISSKYILASIFSIYLSMNTNQLKISKIAPYVRYFWTKMSSTLKKCLHGTNSALYSPATDLNVLFTLM